MSSWADKQKLSTWNLSLYYSSFTIPDRSPSFAHLLSHLLLQIFLYSSSSSSTSLDLRSPDLYFSSLDLHFPDHVLCSSSSFEFGSSVLVLLLHLHLRLRSSDTSIEFEFEKLKFHVNKLFLLSTRTWVFEAGVCHQTRASQTQDASFLNGFKTVLTNRTIFKNYASWQISPKF